MVIEKIKTMISKHMFDEFVVLLQSIKFRLFSKASIISIISEIFKSLLDSLPEVVKKFYPGLASAVIGIDIEKIDKGQMYTPSERIHIFLQSFVMIFIPDFEKPLHVLENFVKFLVNLIKIGSSKEGLLDKAAEIAEEMGMAFGVNPQEIHGIIGVMQGDYKALVDFTAPYCKLNPTTLKTLIGLLTDSNSSLTSMENLATAEISQGVDENVRSNYISLMRKVNEGSANVKELFQLCDLEGDSSGGISKAEFKSLMVKLGIVISDHRVAEIFSKCKSKESKNLNELDIKGINVSLIS